MNSELFVLRNGAQSSWAFQQLTWHPKQSIMETYRVLQKTQQIQRWVQLLKVWLFGQHEKTEPEDFINDITRLIDGINRLINGITWLIHGVTTILTSIDWASRALDHGNLLDPEKQQIQPRCFKSASGSFLDSRCPLSLHRHRINTNIHNLGF